MMEQNNQQTARKQTCSKRRKTEVNCGINVGNYPSMGTVTSHCHKKFFTEYCTHSLH